MKTKSLSTKKNPIELYNQITGERVSAIIVGENNIDDKIYWILESNGRFWQAAKDSWKTSKPKSIK